jgi:hypothetical protein
VQHEGYVFAYNPFPNFDELPSDFFRFSSALALIFLLIPTNAKHPESPPVVFTDSCAAVQAEMQNRVSGVGGWSDPHNRGTYTLNSVTPSSIAGHRLTGDGKYTDEFEFSFASTGTGGGGCAVAACSESQVTSVIDFSTNYCNLRNLYCSPGEGCPGAGGPDLSYYESFVSCGQRDATRCVVAAGAQKPPISGEM